MIGSFLQTAKGVKDNHQLKEGNRKLTEKLEEFTNPENVLRGIEGPFEQTVARNQLVMAEYMAVRLANVNSCEEILELWERVKMAMNENIQRVEEQLRQETATKLDIMRFATGLTQLSGEFDKELLLINEKEKELEGKVKQLESAVMSRPVDQGSLHKTVDELIDKIKALGETDKKWVRQTKQLNDALITLSQQQKRDREGSVLLKEELIRKIDSLKEQSQLELADAKKQYIQSLQSAQEENFKERKALEKWLKDASSQVWMKVHLLEDNLRLQKEQLTEASSMFDARMLRMQREQKEMVENQKGLLLKLTVPLYVAISGILSVGGYWFFN